jgi:hypothetical protein
MSLTPGLAASSAELSESLADEQAPNRDALLRLPVGLHESVPESTYHARVSGMASKGALDWIDEVPAKYKAWLDWELEDSETKALRLGVATHMAVLEPEKFSRTYIIEPDFGPCRKNDPLGVSSEAAKENKKRRDDWRDRHKGARLLPADSGRQLLGMVQSIRADKACRRIFERAGRSEITARWDDPDTGLPCKSRMDHYVLDDSLALVVDVKTCLNARWDAFTRAIHSMRYDVQDQHYREGLTRLNQPVDGFVFIAVEKTPPYLCAAYQIRAEDLIGAKGALRRNMATLAECTRTGLYPGYTDGGIVELSLPPYMRREP